MSKPDHLQSRIQLEIAELTASVSGLIENFHRLKNPLIESHEKVPQATNQLDKISQQTEEAAHRMLDMIEQITQREEQVISGLSDIVAKVAAGETTTLGTLAANLQEHANTNLNDAYTLMDALQFQDITSQQMNHAASLLDDIEGKLRNILEIIAGDSFKDSIGIVERSRKERAYDPHADMYERRTEQSDIDSLFDKTKVK